MSGLPTEVQGGIDGGTWGQRYSLYAAFVQDDWRVTDRLVVNLGAALRTEHAVGRSE